MQETETSDERSEPAEADASRKYGRRSGRRVLREMKAGLNAYKPMRSHAAGRPDRGALSRSVPMRSAILSVLIISLSAAAAGADPIRYEHIPADASGYFHADLDRIFASHLCQALGGATDVAAGVEAQFGG